MFLAAAIEFLRMSPGDVIPVILVRIAAKKYPDKALKGKDGWLRTIYTALSKPGPAKEWESMPKAMAKYKDKLTEWCMANFEDAEY